MSLVHVTQWLDAHTSRPATEDAIRIIATHAALCAACRSLLNSDDEIRRRLALLRLGEPRIDVLGQVMRRIEEIESN